MYLMFNFGRSAARRKRLGLIAELPFATTPQSPEFGVASMAGYSKTPLSQKLGIKENHAVALPSAPADFQRTLGELPAGVAVVDDAAAAAVYDIILFFTMSRAELRRRFAALAGRLDPAGGFWIGWPKKTSGVATDLTEDVIRGIGLEAGLVDNKVCAIDDVWSGLRFVARPARPAQEEIRNVT